MYILISVCLIVSRVLNFVVIGSIAKFFSSVYMVHGTCQPSGPQYLLFHSPVSSGFTAGLTLLPPLFPLLPLADPGVELRLPPLRPLPSLSRFSLDRGRTTLGLALPALTGDSSLGGLRWRGEISYTLLPIHVQ